VLTVAAFSQELTLLPADNQRLSNFCGQLDAHLHQIEQRLHVDIANRSNHFKITGVDAAVKSACAVMQKLFELAGKEAESKKIHY
jgi:phosphate starvation-inducible protein PhoH and related proteins